MKRRSFFKKKEKSELEKLAYEFIRAVEEKEIRPAVMERYNNFINKYDESNNKDEKLCEKVIRIYLKYFHDD